MCKYVFWQMFNTTQAGYITSSYSDKIDISCFYIVKATNNVKHEKLSNIFFILESDV